MANVFGILTAIVLALSAFIAYKNKTAYETKLSDKQSAADKLTASTARLTAAKEVLDGLPGQISGVESEVEKLTSDEKAVTDTNTGLKGQSEPKTKKIAENKEKLDAIREKTSKTGNINELAAKVRATNAELEELTQTVASAEAKLANLTAQHSSSEGLVSNAKTKFENFSNGQSLPELKTRIRSIYPNWGFVTLASGNNAGVVTNSTLDVVRDGETVAKLLVTAVESNTSSASIVPDSLSSDVTLAVGDRVVPGQKAAKTSGN
jgi:predicted RNase H-like nuclease (RuvC/YqgF family)